MMINIVKTKNNILAILFVLIISLLFLSITEFITGYPDYLITSFLIVLTYLAIIIQFGLVSIPSFIVAAVAFPATAFLWAWLNGAKYINARYHWLQDQSFFVDKAVFHVFVTMAIVFTILLAYKKYIISYTIPKRTQHLDDSLYIFTSVLFLFFFWLTDPGETILTASYKEVLSQRYAATQFASSLGMLFWLISLITYLKHKSSFIYLTRNSIRYFADKIFILFTVIAIFWLLLHAKRSEPIGMFLIVFYLYAERKGKKKAAIYLLLVFFLFAIIGFIRTTLHQSFLHTLQNIPLSGYPSSDIASLPGGASSIFGTYLNTIHYFEEHSLFYGKTFFNYICQALPTPINDALNLSLPPLFHDIVLEPNYSWSGGNYIVNYFYANFGILGPVFCGVFVSLYIFLIFRCLKSNLLGIKVIGFFLLATVLRSFWYELINLIKPIYLMLLAQIIFSTVRSTIDTTTQVKH